MDPSVDGDDPVTRTKEELYEFACHEGNADIVKAILTSPRSH